MVLLLGVNSANAIMLLPDFYGPNYELSPFKPYTGSPPSKKTFPYSLDD